MTHDPTRDCEHGRLKGKCDVCDLQAEVERLNKAIEAQIEKIGCVNHDCDKCKAVQEPVAVVSGYYGGQCVVLPINPARLFNSGTAFYTAPQPVPVKTYHDGKPWPVAPKPWVGLTDEEVMQTMSGDWTSQFYFARAIEAQLKEKNT
jgi:hypothetical protein